MAEDRSRQTRDFGTGGPSGHKRRVKPGKNGGVSVEIVIPPDKKEAIADDLEYQDLSENEKEEFDTLSKHSTMFSSRVATSTSSTLRTSTKRTQSTASMGDAYKEGLILVHRLERDYDLHRQTALENMKFDTPLGVLTDLAHESGIGLHFEYHETRNGLECPRFLVELFAGSGKGFGEAVTKKMAAQMAAAHLLQKMERVGKTIPPYYLLRGCRINPRIFGDLDALCRVVNLFTPNYILQPKDPELIDGPLYTIKCQIGKFFAFGQSDCLSLARRSAAKNAFENLTGRVVPQDFVCSGSACMSLVHANIIPASSAKKRMAIAHRVQKFEHEIGTDDTASSGHGVGIQGRSRDLDQEFEEELDVAFEAVGGLDPGTMARINAVVENMTDEVKDRLGDLRLSETKKKDMVG